MTTGNELSSVVVGIVKTIQLVVVTLVLWIFYGIANLIPSQWQSKKSVRNDLVLLTGAGSGIGRTLSVEFAKLGSRLVLWDVNESTLEDTVALCRIAGAAEIKSYVVDLGSKNETYKCGVRVQQECGDVDIIIHYANIVAGMDFLDTSDAQNETTMSINSMSHLWITKTFLPKMLQQNKGHIVTVSTLAGLFGTAQLVDYSMSKFADVGFLDALSVELYQKGKTGIKTTIVCPYYVDKDQYDSARSAIRLLNEDYATQKIVEAILTNQHLLIMPKVFYWLYALKTILPTQVSLYVFKQLGIVDSMYNFRGRRRSTLVH